jgi:putative acyl-CoA dehydrogenase
MLVEPLAITWQAATLLRYGDPVVAETFAVNRLGSGRGLLYGSLGAAADRDHIIARTTPTL